MLTACGHEAAVCLGSTVFKSIDSGQESAASIFELPRPGGGPADLKARLKAMIEPAPADAPAAPDSPGAIDVRTGVKPFTWLVTEKDDVGKTVMEYLVSKDDQDVYVCNCQPKSRDCDHVLAAMRFALQP
jgi:hypothetical protein